MVTGRAVGIGAYLVRLAQRVIQVESSFIILTGYRPLNSVLGANVYSSNQQLGGPQIMARNGVSHLTVTDDFMGVRALLHWLSYIPSHLHEYIQNIPEYLTTDPPDRPVTADVKESLKFVDGSLSSRALQGLAYKATISPLVVKLRKITKKCVKNSL